MSTFSRQHEVPRLPLPSLEQTVEKYLKTVEPYAATREEFERTKLAAQQFLGDKEVHRRQQALEKLAKDKVSWMEDMWLDVGYLQWRAALPVNSNVTGYLVGKHRKQWPQAFSASALVVGALQYHKGLLEETIPINTTKAGPQSMDQYRRMFCLTRTPQPVQDAYVQTLASTHIAVLCGKRVYQVEVMDPTKKHIILPNELQSHLEQIMADAKQRGDDVFPVPALTGAERTTWAHNRVKLQAVSQANQHSLSVVESAIFAVSLDFKVDRGDAEVARSTLVGDGRNCWYDKSFSIIVKGDGNPSIHLEHSWADAPTPLDMFFNYALKFAESEFAQGHVQAKPASAMWPKPKQVEFELTEELKRAVRAAEEFTDGVNNDSDLEVMNCFGLGKPVWKQAGLSPDAAVQMAMQLAYRRMHGGDLPVATYETIGMSGFAHGRTEACRVVSSASEQFVKTALSGFVLTRSEKDRAAAEVALRKACEAHLQYIMEGQQGKGVDRHLLGLRLQSQDGTQPALFQDPLFARSGSTGGFVISTSNNSYINRPFAGMFGSSGMTNGYGVCYIPRDEGVHLCVESKLSHPESNSAQFCKMVNECLLDIALIAGVALPKSML